jgi:S1-C subfamily serine protease
MRAAGSVSALNRSITAQEDDGSAERVTRLIETNAALVPGDSGGPLLDGAGRVVGMDTAGSSGLASSRASAGAGYAIPIGRALTIAGDLVAGTPSARIHLGPTAWLGITTETVPAFSAGHLSAGTPAAGTAIVGVLAGGPAATAGLVPGDVITAVAGKRVGTPTAIASVVLAHAPPETVTVTYTDTSGATQTASVVLGSGPPQ